MRKIYLLLALCCVNFVAHAQTGLPIAYWSLEDATHVTQSLAVTDYITGAYSVTASPATGAGSVGTVSAPGAGIFHGGTVAGLGLGSVMPGTNAQGSATGYWEFTITGNTATSGQTYLQLDAIIAAGGATNMYLGILFSNDGGTTFTALTAGTNQQVLTTWKTFYIPLSATFPNVNVVRIYGYNNTTSLMTIDNVTLCSGISAVGTRFTTVDENDVYSMSTGGSTGGFITRGGFGVSANSNVFINNTTPYSGPNMSNSFSVSTAPDTITFGNQSYISGTGNFTTGTGGTVLVTANPSGINSAGTSGSLRCTGINCTSVCTYVFDGTVVQSTGNAINSTLGATAIIAIDNPAGVILGENFTSGPATVDLETGTFSVTGTYSLVANGTTINVDNGTFNATPPVYTNIVLTYMPLGVDNLAYTTGYEWPAIFPGTTIVNKPGAVISLNGNKSNTGNITLTAGSLDATTSNYNISLDGNWINNSSPTAFVPRSGTMTMNGINALLNVGGTQTTNFNNFSESITSSGFGDGEVILGNTIYVNGTLTLSSGLLNIGANNLILGTATPAVAGGPFAQTGITGYNYIVASGTGQVEKQMSGNGSFLYPIGDASATNDYTPITLNFTGGTYNAGAEAGVNVQNVKDPNNYDVTDYINRYWNVCVENISSPAYTVSANFLTADLVGPYTAVDMAQWTGATPWIMFTTAGTNTITTAPTVISTTGCSQFTGISNGSPVAVIAAHSPGICAGGTITLSGTGSTGAATPLSYTWSPSATLSASTGISVVATPTATVTVYTLTVTDANGATASTTTTVNANPVPNPITGNPTVCVGYTTSLSSSTTGGTWESTGNVSLTGSTSNPIIVTGGPSGTGTVSYVLGGGCAIGYEVTVNPNPNGITGNMNICQGATTTVSSTTTGGTWGPSGAIETIVGASGTATVTASAINTGTAPITYTLPTSCYITATVTVNAQPTAIQGTLDACVGLTSALSDLVGVGTWASSNGNATVGSSSGIVMGVNGGVAGLTSTITYALGICSVTATFTTNPNPANITGVVNVCMGSTTSLSTTTLGGTWSESNTNVGFTTGSNTTTVTGVAVGTTVLTYTVGTGCIITTTVNVVADPTTITGVESVCVGLTTSLSSAGGVGTWSSSVTADGTVGSTSGIVTGINGGGSFTTTTITFTQTSTGCTTSAVVTVNANPIITSTAAAERVCVGATSTLTATPVGGTWSSSLPADGTIDPVLGVFGGIAGPANPVITYTVSTGCIASITATVNPNPNAITGNGVICEGLTTTLSSTTAGGTWMSSATTIATAGTTTGATSTITASSSNTGNSTITYTLPTGCYATSVVTVNTQPTAITGTEAVCVGLTTSLNSTPAGGTWMSSNPADGSINSSTGVLSGLVGYNTTTITYTLGDACFVTAVATINPNPAPITGNDAVCMGLTTTLSTTTAAGTWTSSAVGTASVTTGATTTTVTGVAVGNATISYSLATGCYALSFVTVNTQPAAITANPSFAVCVGATTTLNSTTAGGTWVSSIPANGSIGSVSGVVTGLNGGATFTTTNITYTLGDGCFVTSVVTVDANPTTITGNPSLAVCVGSTTTLNSTPAGGEWISGTPADGSISATGVVTGVNGGGSFTTTVITYSLTTTGCSNTAVVTVNANPTAITGNPSLAVCVGLTTTLNSTPAGGVWSSSLPADGTVGAANGVLGGINGYFTPTITYSLTTTGCKTTAIATINPNPATITGSLNVCVGLTTSLSSTTLGGTWSSSNGNSSTGTAVSNTTLVTGDIAGTSIITYELPTTCLTTTVVTVNTQPAPITGPQLVCVGSTITLNATPAGGTWTSSNALIGTVGSTTGVVGGVGALGGSTTISYTLGDGCYATYGVTVNPIPTPITATPSFSVCVGFTTTLNSTPVGGAWISSTPGNGSISTTGVVTGILAGTTTITYFGGGAGCSVTAVVTINTQPTAITGTDQVCVGLTTSLNSTPAGGTWSSTLPADGSISTTGVVTGINGGVSGNVTTIEYLLNDGCFVTVPVTINPNPAAITGVESVCAGLTTSLSTTTASVSWTAANGNAIVTTTGGSTTVVTGVNGSTTDIITATLATGCLASVTVTINTQPTAITANPAFAVCVGLTTSLNSTPAGGTWTSSIPADGSVGSATGIVTGVNGGATGTTTDITYTLSDGCFVNAVVTVNPNPAAITGNPALKVCVGLTTTLNTTPAGGTWLSSNPLDGSISATGVVTGLTGSTTTNITYTLPTGCINTAVVTINPNPTPITANPSFAVCVGLTTSLNTTPAGGVWTSSNPADGSISATGVVTGLIGSTTTTITNTLATGCLATAIVTINPNPATITANPSFDVCVGLTTSLNTTPAGGTWTSSNPLDGSISTTGVVTGLTGSTTTTITYTLPTTCINTAVVTINPNPTTITANPSFDVCVGLTTSLNSTPGGGTWTSSNPGNGSISATGVVTGVNGGATFTTTTITYTLGTGCINTAVVTINPNPAAITANPSFAVCVGLTTSLNSTTAGGTWTSSNPLDGSISATGVVTGLTGSTTTTIDYTLATGCLASAVVTINPNPATITANPSFAVCVGLTTSLNTTPAGGIWTSSNPLDGSISATGVVTGLTGSTTTTITYTLPTTCLNTAVVTINPNPTNITGTDAVCTGLTTSLNSTPTGGTWTSSNGDASVGSATGVVTGIVCGNTSTITYTLSTGCINKTTVTINCNPTAITGSPTVCVGLNTTLNSTPAGGTWSSSNPGVGSFAVSTSGVLTGVSGGTTTVTYTLSTGCINTLVVTVNGDPTNITATPSLVVCVGQTTTLNSTPAGGTWSSGSPLVGSINSVTGVVTGVSGGTTSITYTLGTGCSNPTSTIVTVNPNPTNITGADSVCVGLTTTLNSTPAGGTWTSSNTTVGSIAVSTTGIVTGVSAGTTAITYTLPTGCMNVAANIVTVNPNPSPITSTPLCSGSTATLNATPAGGTWTSSNTASGTVGSTTGIVTAFGVGGTTTISYTLFTTCASSTVLTVNPTPTAIAGVDSVCVGLTTQLSTTPLGGTWTSSNGGIAGVNPFTGLVTGNSGGTVVITNTLATGCFNDVTVTVNPDPSAISGSLIVCVGLTTTLNATPAGGTWISSNSAVASVGSATGVVTGNEAGTATITYELITGCMTTAVVTVNPNPAPITGADSVCVGLSTALTDATTGGIWLLSNTLLTITGTGVATAGVVSGMDTITYKISATGCVATTIVTINPDPTAILGIDSVCVGLTTTLSSTPGGGTWSSSNAHAFASGTSGVVTGVSAGTATITYTLITGCFNTTVVTVNPLPLPITGADSVCVGLTTALTDGGGGTWSASNGNATIGTSGIVHGITAGTDVITYTLITGCLNTVTVTINPNPVAITGIMEVCSGLTTTLTDATTGGTWTSSNTAIATVGLTTGVVTGGSVTTTSTATITYTLPTGCLITTVVTVNPLPGAITGTLSVCQGLTTTLSDAGGGTWSLSNTNASIIGVVVTGQHAGMDTVTYTLSTGCIAQAVVTVDGLPSAVNGSLSLCPGLTSQLSDTSAGGTGTWSGGTTGIATITSTGLVTADTVLTASTTTITYTVPTGCIITAVVTVNPLPTPILGDLNICSGLTTSLYDATTGGTWSTASTSVSVTSSTGLVTGGIVAAGTTDTATIIYTITSTGCTAVTVVTVDPIPSAVYGTLTVCSGLTTQLYDSTAGGTWSSSNNSIAGITPGGGLVTGGNAGTATITYTLATGCITTIVVTVNPLPTAINGTLIFCAGVTSLLTDAVTGGTWTTSDIYIAQIPNPSIGDVYGSAGGTATITYTLPSSCYITAIVTVEPLPGAILGDLQVCQGLTTQLSDLTAGGTWSINPPTTVASISGAGLVSGNLSGTAIVSYTLSTGCGSTAIVTVNPLPAAISGTPAVCLGLTTTLTDATTGGTWSSSNTSIAGIDPITGIVSGVGTGTATITYTLPTGCIMTIVVTVNPLPSAISGSLDVCVGLTTSLSDVGGGSWSMSNTNASVNPGTGTVTGINPGLDTVTYTLPTGCIITATVTIYALPSTITGNLTVCTGLTTALSDTPVGGTWSMSNGNATINGSTGLVTGDTVSVASYDTVTYNLATGCTATAYVTVNPLPTAIVGASELCVGVSTTYTDAATGGTWSSSNTSIVAIVSGTGVATGESAGTATITYTLPTGCITTMAVTVTGQPDPISGNPTICLNSTTSLSDTTSGGTWSSSNPAVGSVSSTGIVYGAALGTATISYTLAAGCVVSVVVTVNPLPNVYSLTPTSGSYCAGGAGIDLILTGSQVGVSYLLYYDSSVTGYRAGTGDSINFGNEYVQGTYTVLATNSTTGCSIGMINSAYITINPTVAPIATIVSLPGDTVCSGTTVTYSVNATNAGSAPTYKWFVNHVLVGITPTYTFIPANGDLVSVILTSNAPCVMPNTATDSVIMYVPESGYPIPTLTIFPGDTVCQYSAATFTATATFGGPSPTFTWFVNGTDVGTGPVYSFVPVTGDVVTCLETSDYHCRLADSAYSSAVTMTVQDMVVPHVIVTSSRGNILTVGEYDTLRTTVTNAGSDPGYQWYVNGTIISGATADTFVSQFNNYDSVNCVVTSSGYCEGVSSFGWIFITVYPESVQQISLGSGDIRLIPNPNKGEFTVSGTLGGQVTGVDEEVSLEITDMLGQVIYRNKVVVQNGKLNEQIRLSNSLANGMYLLNLTSGSNSKAFHFVIEQ